MLGSNNPYDKIQINKQKQEIENILDKKINYEEQDIIIDPRSNKGENIDEYFEKNAKKNDTISKNIKAKKIKVFDQDYDLEKCEIIDLDKNSYDKIINMIFAKRSDIKYLDHINKLTKEGFVIEDDDLDNNSETY